MYQFAIVTEDSEEVKLFSGSVRYGQHKPDIGPFQTVYPLRRIKNCVQTFLVIRWMSPPSDQALHRKMKSLICELQFLMITKSCGYYCLFLINSQKMTLGSS